MVFWSLTHQPRGSCRALFSAPAFFETFSLGHISLKHHQKQPSLLPVWIPCLFFPSFFGWLGAWIWAKQLIPSSHDNIVPASKEASTALHLLEGRKKETVWRATLPLATLAVLVIVTNPWSLAVALLGSRSIQGCPDVKFYCPWKQTSPPSWPVKQYLLQGTSAYLKPTHPKPKVMPGGEILFCHVSYKRRSRVNSIHKITAVIFQLAERLHRSKNTVASKWFLICTILVFFLLSMWCRACQKPSLQLLTGRLEIMHDGFHHFSTGWSSISTA